MNDYLNLLMETPVFAPMLIIPNGITDVSSLFCAKNARVFEKPAEKYLA
jgi:hypothetical protein